MISSLVSERGERQSDSRWSRLRALHWPSWPTWPALSRFVAFISNGQFVIGRE
jgi:hypothetical protein